MKNIIDLTLNCMVINDKEQTVFFIQKDDVKIGRCTLIKHDNIIELTDFGIDEPYRRLGNAGLVVDMIKNIKENVFVEVLEFNTPALALFEKFGFKENQELSRPNAKYLEIKKIIPKYTQSYLDYKGKTWYY